MGGEGSSSRIPGYRITGESKICSIDSNPFAKALKRLGLDGARPWERLIPKDYLLSSPENRLSLLQGLLDVDGEVRSDHSAFSTTSKELADGITFVVRSLGGITKTASGIPHFNTREARREFKILITLPSELIATRAKEWIAHRTRQFPNRITRTIEPNRTIKSIEPAGIEEVICISVDAPDQLYVTNDFIVTHNTIQSIFTYSYLKALNPSCKALILTEKIALRQWMNEFNTHTKGLDVRIITATTHPDKDLRISALRNGNSDVTISTYSLMYKYLDYMREGLGENFVLFADEPNYFKSTSSQLHRNMFNFAIHAKRVYGLTATVLENRLEEVYGITRVIYPGYLSNEEEFQKTYCVMQKIKQLKWPVVVGYKNLDHFRAKMEPIFLGRREDDPEVQQSLPELLPKDLEIELGLEQSRKVMEATDKIIQMPSGNIKKLDILAALTVTQQVVNDPALLGFNIPSAKTEATLELLKNSLAGEKVIIHSKFRTQIDLLEKAINKSVGKTVRITGTESQEKRERAQDLFMTDGARGVNILLMTRAGIKAGNLQKGNHLIFFDLPWSYGHYIQAIGRLRRLGSLHQKIVIYRLLAVLHPKVVEMFGDERTVDHSILRHLVRKKALFDILTGDTTEIKDLGGDLQQIIEELKSTRKPVSKDVNAIG